jgi:hypothetical protein
MSDFLQKKVFFIVRHFCAFLLKISLIYTIFDVCDYGFTDTFVEKTQKCLKVIFFVFKNNFNTGLILINFHVFIKRCEICRAYDTPLICAYFCCEDNKMVEIKIAISRVVHEILRINRSL